MKKHIRPFSFIALLVLSAPVFSSAAAGDEDVRKQRIINRSYSVTNADKLDIDNQFGNVVVSTWDKNEITVDIEISARAATEDKAQDILDKIDVKDDHTGHDIRFKTKVGEIHNSKGNHGSDDNRSFYIDYVVHMPAGNPLHIENSFGKTEVPSFKGLVSLTSKFGSLNAGKLDNVDQIDVEFGKVFISEVSNGRIAFKFDKESHIDKISGSVKVNSEFSHNVQLIVADNIEDLSLNESYSTVRVVVAHNLSAQVSVHTSFGSFHNDSDFGIEEKKEDEGDYGPHFDKDYNGVAGDGKGNIHIKSSFGNVRMTHDASDSGDRSGNQEKAARNRSRSRDRDRDKDKDRDSDDDNDNDNDNDHGNGTSTSNGSSNGI